jgi:hypothetical protein
MCIMCISISPHVRTGVQYACARVFQFCFVCPVLLKYVYSLFIKTLSCVKFTFLK